MKINWNKKYTTIAIYSLIVLAVGVLFVVFVFKFDSISNGFSWVGAVIAPVICGIIIAYILNPLMVLLENKLFGKLKSGAPPAKSALPKKIKEIEEKNPEKTAAYEKKRASRRKALARVLSLILTYVILFAVIAGIAFAVVPNVASSLVDLAEKLPDYLKQAEAFLNDFFKDNPQISQILFKEFTNISDALQKFVSNLDPNIINNVGSSVWNFLLSLLMGLKNVLLGLIIAIYLLYSKERLLAQSKKILFAFIKNERCERLFTGLNKCNNIFKKYIISNLLDAMIVFVFMVIGMFAMGMPYQMLISAICAVTNLIPFFGPFIGAIPSGILILLVDPSKVIWFALFVLILQQCDGNIIKPHLFGETMGLPAIWVLVSIIVGGGLFGVPGMLLGAPVFAVIYLLFAEFVSGKLRKKNLPSDTEPYFKGTAEFAEEYIDEPPNKVVEDFSLSVGYAPEAAAFDEEKSEITDNPEKAEKTAPKSSAKPKPRKFKRRK